MTPDIIDLHGSNQVSGWNRVRGMPTQARRASVLNRCLAAFVLVAALGLLPMTAGARPAKPPAAHVTATCDDYESQADAQRAADTRDADGDGIYCVIYSA